METNRQWDRWDHTYHRTVGVFLRYHLAPHQYFHQQIQEENKLSFVNNAALLLTLSPTLYSG